MGGANAPHVLDRRVEQVVEQLVLTALEPLGVEAMIAATAAHVRANESMRVRWDQQIERARYEVDLARRQYDAVDPANRLVAGELERRWEVVLKAMAERPRQAGAQLEALQRLLSDADQQSLQRAATDLSRVWHAPTTRVAVVLVPPDAAVPHSTAPHTRTPHSRLIVVHGGTVELRYRYEGWVRFASRPIAPRVDLTPLADELRAEEHDGRWVFEGVDAITPRLHFDGANSDLSAESVVLRMEQALRTGAPAWNPYGAP